MLELSVDHVVSNYPWSSKNYQMKSEFKLKTRICWLYLKQFCLHRIQIVRFNGLKKWIYPYDQYLTSFSWTSKISCVCIKKNQKRKIFVTSKKLLCKKFYIHYTPTNPIFSLEKAMKLPNSRMYMRMNEHNLTYLSFFSTQNSFKRSNKKNVASEEKIMRFFCKIQTISHGSWNIPYKVKVINVWV